MKLFEFWVLSQFEFLGFVTNWFLKFFTIWVLHWFGFFRFHNLGTWVSSQFQFLVLPQFKCYHNLSFWGVTTWVFEFCQTGVFVFLYIIWVFKLCHNFGFWVLSQFEFLCFEKFLVIEFCHNLLFFFSFWQNLNFLVYLFFFCHILSFWILSLFKFLSFVTIFFYLNTVLL